MLGSNELLRVHGEQYLLVGELNRRPLSVAKLQQFFLKGPTAVLNWYVY